MDTFSIVTSTLCFAAAIGSVLMGNYWTALIFVVALYNIGSWMYLEKIRMTKNAKR